MRKRISSPEAYLEKTAAALICSNRSQVPRFRFASDRIFDRVQRSAPPLTAEAASLIEKETPALRSHIRALRTKKALKTRSPRQKCLFSQVIVNLCTILV